LATVATSFVPSAEDVNEDQFLVESLAVQFAPELVEVYIWPLETNATSFTPSAEDATEVQDLFESRGVQFAPELVEVYI
jgi:hypothetical protein